LSHQHPPSLPAAGWIENLRRIGTKLVADFKDIPKKIFDIIQAHGYKGKSAEIFWDIDVNGKKYPRLLKAVAILGIDQKAVQSINDLVSNYEATFGEMVKGYEGAVEARIYDSSEIRKEEDDKMDELQVKLATAEKSYAEALSKIKEVSDALEVANAALATAEKRAEGAEFKLAEFAQAEAIRKVVATVDKLIAEAKLAPAKKEYAIALLSGISKAGEKKYKLGEKEYSMEEIAMELLEGGKVDLNTEDQSEVGERQAADLDGKTKEYMAKHEGVSYKDALRAVSPNGK
jgi:hypothetical protein